MTNLSYCTTTKSIHIYIKYSSGYSWTASCKKLNCKKCKCEILVRKLNKETGYIYIYIYIYVNICFTSLDLISSNTEDVSQTHAAMQEVSVAVNDTIMKNLH